MKVKNYVRAESLEQAYQLNQKRSARLVGGMLWQRLGRGTVMTAVDLSGLGLNEIEETEEEFRIGCMVTLRQLEKHKGLEQYTQGAVREAVRSIVGVQFRNLATVGGSIWGRFGFSDVLTVFLALDTQVELYKGGLVPLDKFAEQKKDNDILVRLIVKKRKQDTVYSAFRNTRTDFPVLTCAVSMTDTAGTAAVGARPGRAVCLELSGEFVRMIREGNETEEVLIQEAERLASQIPTGSNLRAGAEYRSHLCRVLLRRSFETLSNSRSGKKEQIEKTETQSSNVTDDSIMSDTAREKNGSEVIRNLEQNAHTGEIENYGKEGGREA